MSSIALSDPDPLGSRSHDQEDHYDETTPAKPLSESEPKELPEGPQGPPEQPTVPAPGRLAAVRCTAPLNGFRLPDGRVSVRPSTGLHHLVDGHRQTQIPCGQCMACRLRRANEDAVRVLHEASLYERNSFITLTYDEEHLPPDHGLHVRDWQLFMKSLRKKTPNRLRYFMVGEYGEINLRPHFHAIIFNEDFRSEWTGCGRSDKGQVLFRSESVESAWGRGKTTIDHVNIHNANYVARYHRKKRNGEQRDSYVRLVDDQLVKVRPEFSRRSTGGRSGEGGIGSGWYKKYKADLFSYDECIVQGQRYPVPSYYREKLRKENPDLYESLKAKRREALKESIESKDRCEARAGVLKARTTSLRRRL